MWFFDGKPFVEQPDREQVGFVYHILEKSTGMLYIGIKRLWRGRSNNPSDWKDYNSSSKLLQEKIKNNPDDYHKEIVRFCTSITEMKAFEAFEQLSYYMNGDWDKLYNEYIGLRLRIRKEEKKCR